MLLVTLFATTLGLAQPQATPAADAPKLEMMTYQMVFLRRGTTPEPQGAEARRMQDEHLERLAELNRKRLNVLYGPFTDNGELVGIALFDVKDAGEAQRFMADDPFVKSGALVMDVKPWMGPKGWFKDPPDRDVNHPGALEQLVFGFLVRGLNRSQSEAEAQELQKAHLAYMDKLHQDGKLIAAGPFLDDSDMRGIVVYRVPSVEDANQLAAGDPMVKAGRLRLEAHPWMTLKGILQ